MTEKEYINTKALGTITAAISTLRDIVPESLKDIMTQEEYDRVMPTLCDWQDRLFKKIKVK